ncbi:MAG: membrane protein insertion efficiency factor YidD [Betaproteobacteria bacterium TMED156]|nr:MAG: membrane protein insertion efficiency factor YidD [Betaproteobacteria bacterium TMED156]|tara:strand:+ start:321 stop:620 length:300 start_codon:yes stop_codon:yes gene_type:complete
MPKKKEIFTPPKILLNKFRLAFVVFFIGIIRIYQVFSFFTKPSCRFYPTCSEYAKEALVRHGPIIGGKLALARILNCRPFGKNGIDLVPNKNKGSNGGH